MNNIKLLSCYNIYFKIANFYLTTQFFKLLFHLLKTPVIEGFFGFFFTPRPCESEEVMGLDLLCEPLLGYTRQ